MAGPAKKTAEEEAEQEGITEEELQESVGASLSKVFGETPDDEEDGNEDTDDDEQAEEDEDVDDSTPEDSDDDEDDDDTQAEEDDEDDDSTPDDEKGKDKSGSEEEVTLPDAYHRAAVHQGWEPEEIKEFFEASPEKAVKTFAKIHESTNKLSSEFARIGRLKPAKEKEAAAKTDDTADENAAEIAALKEQYGEDSAVVKIVLAQQKTINKLAAQPEPEANQQDADEELNPVIVERIQKFFVDPTLKPYNDFYGKGKDEAKLTREQSDNRYKVLETADSIVLGCQRQGREITLGEALESAHLLVSEPEREKALRTELKAQVKKRARGKSLKPARSKKVATEKDASKMTEKEREAKVAANLQKTFR